MVQLITGVATMGPRGAMVPSLLSYFSIVSISWFTFAIVSIFIIMLWPPHLFSARNAPATNQQKKCTCKQSGLLLNGVIIIHVW